MRLAAEGAREETEAADEKLCGHGVRLHSPASCESFPSSATGRSSSSPAPLSLALRERGVDEVVLHTGQHYDPELSAVFFDELELAPPRYRLETGSGTHGEQTGRMLPEIEAAVLEEQPDAVLVFGDTNSTLAGALAAGKLLVPVAHVEAGLRSFDRAMPEELNRMLVDRLSSLLFCPTDVAVANLAAEGITRGRPPGRRRHVRRQPPARPARARALGRTRDGTGSSRAATSSSRSTARPTSRPEPLARIAEALGRAGRAGRLPGPPAHDAPRSRPPASTLPDNVRVLPPAGYLDFAALASQARVVLTDSGGVQKEAYWYGVPCVTLRTTTEWVETIETGWNRLVGSDPEAIVAAAREAAPRPERPRALRRRPGLGEDR